jgi:SAM-dependent methyltransferase
VAEFDQYGPAYDDRISRAVRLSGQEHDFFLQVKAEVLAELLGRSSRQRDLRVLDVGCGNGRLHRFLLSATPSIKLTGIEVAAAFVEPAREANPDVQYDVYDGRRLPYEDATFDAAFTVCVLHHVSPAQWPDFVAELRRVVRPGGLVAVFEHNPLNPVTTYIVRTCPIDRDAVLLPAGQLDALLRGAGLRATRHEFILFTPFKSPIFRRLDRLMSWLPLGAQYVSSARVPQDGPTGSGRQAR